MKGEVPFEGGWRVYSSGAGIGVKLILQRFFGLRPGNSVLGIDPVIPRSLDGLKVELNFAGRRMEVVYRVQNDGFGPARVELNGFDLPFTRSANPYRTGGVEIRMADFEAHLNEGETNRLIVHVG